MNGIVTTAGRPDAESRRLALQACKMLSLPYKERQKRSISAMMRQYGADVLVAGKNRYDFYTPEAKEPFFFHPDTAAFRIKRLMRGEEDPFIQCAGIQNGDTVLDCTLGMATDSILASFVTGSEGEVLGCEVHPIIAFVVEEGLKSYLEGSKVLVDAMRRVKVIQSDSLTYMKTLPNKSVDIVYMDPMFEEVIQESDNFQSLRAAGSHTPLSQEWVDEAIRVAKRKVVLKAHFRSLLFDQYGFQRTIRPTSKFHYGAIDVQTKDSVYPISD